MRTLLHLLLVLPVLVGTAVWPAHASNSPHNTAAQHASSPTPSDAQLEATIHAKLAKSKIGKDGFKFHVQKGVVTWEGSTNVVQHKGSATRMARSAGALQVVNNIQVSAEGKAKSFSAMKKAYVKP